MKHETINSVVAVAGLCIAVFSTAYQLRPLPDDIHVVNEGRVASSDPVSKTRQSIPFDEADEDHLRPIIGPVFWKLRVFNTRDRPVSIVGSELRMIRPDGSEMQYSEIDGGLFHTDKNGAAMLLPTNIPGREARGIFISINIPVLGDQHAEAECIETGFRMRELEICRYRSGTDLFGNPVEAFFDGDEMQAFQWVRWAGEQRQPTYLLTLKTADGSEFSTPLTYYPTPGQF